MPLPSPIPHPLAFFDSTGWRQAVLSQVMSAGWPEGDERALRELAQLWRDAGRGVGPLVEEADQAASAAVAALGGPDAARASALLEFWRRMGTPLNVDLFQELAELAETGAAQIEAAKVAIYAEVADLLSELEILAATSGVTADVSVMCAEPAIVATRFSIGRILRSSADELAEHRARQESAPMPMGRFSFAATAPVPRLAALADSEQADSAGGEGDPGPRHDAAGGDAMIAYGMGSMMAAAAARGGRPTRLQGRYGERAVQGRQSVPAAHDGVILPPPAGGPGEVPQREASPREVATREASTAISREATEALSALDRPAKRPPHAREVEHDSFTLAAMAERKPAEPEAAHVDPALLAALKSSVNHSETGDPKKTNRHAA